jgi:stearoyl-CoA desaturase (delta-9 desaturase)
VTALVTFGEGYHNFHHQFPMDYRNAIKWYQYDPTKWFIWTCQRIGLATHLKMFPDNEIRKGQLTMELKKLRSKQGLEWPVDSNDLPVISWDSFQEQSSSRPLVLISGFIHDVSSFLDEHPGGRNLLAKDIGKDATSAFFGGVYEHSNAAHNVRPFSLYLISSACLTSPLPHQLLSMMRVGVLHGGLELEIDKIVPPSQRLRMVKPHEGASTDLSTLQFEGVPRSPAASGDAASDVDSGIDVYSGSDEEGFAERNS